jgi:hypothetical protein
MVVPALTQLKSNEKFLKDWENVRCDAKVSLFVNDKKIKEDIGEIQLTANGISGICVFNISGLASKNISFGKIKSEVFYSFISLFGVCIVFSLFFSLKMHYSKNKRVSGQCILNLFIVIPVKGRQQ